MSGITYERFVGDDRSAANDDITPRTPDGDLLGGYAFESDAEVDGKEKALEAAMRAIRRQCDALVALNKISKTEPSNQQAILAAEDAYATAMARASEAQSKYRSACGTNSGGSNVMSLAEEAGKLRVVGASPVSVTKALDAKSTSPEAVDAASVPSSSSTSSQLLPVKSREVPEAPELDQTLLQIAGPDSRTTGPVTFAPGDEILIMLERIENIPVMLRAFYRMDPAVRMFVTDCQGKMRSNVVKWPARVSTTDPVWNLPRKLVVSRPKGDSKKNQLLKSGYVHCQLLLPNAGKVGEAQVSLNILTVGRSVGSALRPLLDPQVCTVSFRRLEPPKAKCKYLFLLRHAESEWNWAKANKSLTTLVSQVDHPLTADGMEQARNLRSRLTFLLQNAHLAGSPGTSRGSLPKRSAEDSPKAPEPTAATSPATSQTHSPSYSATTAPSLKELPPEPSALPPPPPNHPSFPNTSSQPTAYLTLPRPEKAKRDNPSQFQVFQSAIRRTPSAPQQDLQGIAETATLTTGDHAAWNKMAAALDRRHPFPPKEFLDKLLEVESVLCSPLTRAIQTCIISLGTHPMWARDKRRRITLLSSIREKRGWCSLDTQGRDAGVALVRRIVQLMGVKSQGKFCAAEDGLEVDKEVRKENKEREGRLSSKDSTAGKQSNSASFGEIRENLDGGGDTKDLSHKGSKGERRGDWEAWLINRIDVNDCTDRWWNTSKETNQALNMRMNEFVNLIKYTAAESVVVVGHSAFFREFVQNYAAPELKEQEPQLVAEKLVNCEMRGIRFNCHRNFIEEIVKIAKA